MGFVTGRLNCVDCSSSEIFINLMAFLVVNLYSNTILLSTGNFKLPISVRPCGSWDIDKQKNICQFVNSSQLNLAYDTIHHYKFKLYKHRYCQRFN